MLLSTRGIKRLSGLNKKKTGKEKATFPANAAFRQKKQDQSSVAKDPESHFAFLVGNYFFSNTDFVL